MPTQKDHFVQTAGEGYWLRKLSTETLKMVCLALQEITVTHIHFVLILFCSGCGDVHYLCRVITLPLYVVLTLS